MTDTEAGFCTGAEHPAHPLEKHPRQTPECFSLPFAAAMRCAGLGFRAGKTRVEWSTDGCGESLLSPT